MMDIDNKLTMSILEKWCRESVHNYDLYTNGNPCETCGSQRCYPEHCDMLREYEAKQKDGE